MKDEYLFLWAQWGILNLDRCRTVLKHYQSFENAWKKITPDFLRQMGMRAEKVQRLFEIKERISFESIMNIVKRFNIKLYFVDDEAYPDILKQSKLAPPFIFVRGELPSFAKSIAIVGTRAYSGYGRGIAERFTADLVREGFVIVSGLALGIDSFAHKSTVTNGGITVAVLGTGVDEIYPRSNYRLAQEILQSGGAIISAYPLGTKGEPHHFPKRNEIVACLTKGTLVVEGGRKSGALITANIAVNEGRGVFAVPTNLNNLALSGANHLIRSSEAKLVENVDHILEDFQMKGSIMRKEPDFTDNERILLERLAHGSKSMDNLVDETTFDIPTLSFLVFHLQIKDAIYQEGAHFFLS